MVRMRSAAAEAATAKGSAEGAKSTAVGEGRLPYKVTPPGYPVPEGWHSTNLFHAVRANSANRGTLVKLAITSVLMAVLPLAAFFHMRDVVLPERGIKQNVDMISALSAILVVQLIIGGYVLMAFAERTDDGAAEGSEGEAKKDK